MRVCTAVSKGSGMATNAWIDPSRGVTDDVIVTDVKEEERI